jgi:thiol-disulfide isomerase/thioredoxin
LLVFSSPGCGPCNALAPQLEEFHRANAELEIVMISKGDPKENRAKVKQHGLTFPIALQQQWEISRRYAMFATPIAYLIDEAGLIAEDVAVGLDPILNFLKVMTHNRTELAGVSRGAKAECRDFSADCGAGNASGREQRTFISNGCASAEGSRLKPGSPD